MTKPGSQPLDEVAELADRIAEAVVRCPDVAGLTQNPGIPVATYLPGRTVVGVAVRPAEVEVCVVARYGPPLEQVAAQVRQAVAPLVPGRVVDVVIGDVAPPRTRPAAATTPAGTTPAGTTPAGTTPGGVTSRSKTTKRKTGESANG